MKENNEIRESKMMQVRRNSVAVRNYVYSSKIILFILDSVLSLFVLPIFSTAFWASVDYIYLYRIADIRITVGLSALLYLLLHTASKSIYRFVVKFASQSKLRFHVAAKTYVYVSSISGILLFDGIDEMCDGSEWTHNIWVNIFMVVFGFSMLFAMKCYVHLAGFGNDVDQESTPEEVFLFPFRMFECSILNLHVCYSGLDTKNTVCNVLCLKMPAALTDTTCTAFVFLTDALIMNNKKLWKKNKLLYLLDSVFSVFITAFLVILVWKGAWSILDAVLPPEELLSVCVSLGVGYALIILSCILQPLMKKCMRKYNGWKRRAALNTYIMLSFCGGINVWRGIWLILDNYVDLENSLRICLALHFGSFFIVVIFNASNTFLVRGVYVDADESGNGFLDFPCYFFRSRFQPQQKEKNLQELDKLNNAQPIQILSEKNGKVISSLSPDANESIELTTDFNGKLNSAELEENQENKIDKNTTNRIRNVL